MSQLPPEAIDEFQALWKKHFNEELPRAEAITRAYQLLTLLEIITEPIPRIHTGQQEQPASSQKRNFEGIAPQDSTH